jgi:hypothetical protein
MAASRQSFIEGSRQLGTTIAFPIICLCHTEAATGGLAELLAADHITRKRSVSTPEGSTGALSHRSLRALPPDYLW